MSEYWRNLHERRIRRRQVLGGAAALSAGVAGLALVGCGGDDDDDDDGGAPTSEATSGEPSGEPTQAPTTEAGQVKRGGILQMMDSIGEDVFDPAITIHAASLYEGILTVYDHINRLSVGFGVEPQMADLPELVDETTLIYTFKPNIFWHDKPPLNGRKFTAEDAAFGLSRFGQDNPEFVFQARLDAVDRYEPVDDATLRIITKQPFAPLVRNIAEDNMVIVSPEAVDEFGDQGMKLFENMVGTGAFLPEHFEPGVVARVVRNPNYWQEGKPYIDGITVTQIVDKARQEAAFVAGEVDMNSGWGMLTTLQEAENYQAQLGDRMRYETKRLAHRMSLHYHCEKPPFNDLRVRKALDLALNRQQIHSARQFNDELTGPVPQSLEPFGFTEEQLLQLPGFRENKDEDLAEAKKLLEAAGFGDGLSFVFTASSPAAEVMQQNWKEIDVEVEFQVLTIVEWITARVAGDYEVMLGSMTEAGDCDAHLYGNVHSSAPANHARFSDPEIDRLCELQRTIFDTEERKAVTDELQMKMLDLVPQSWTFSFTFQNVIRDYVKDFLVVPGYQGFVFGDTWLDKDA